MHDDDDALAGIDLAAWQPPPPPAGTADAVVARMHEPASVAAIDPAERPSRRAWWLGGLGLAAAAAIAALTAWGVARTAHSGSGELVAARALALALDGSSADLDAGAQVRWQRDRHRIAAHQAAGTVRWTVADDDTLVIEAGEPRSAATIEASGASLRMEVPMNLSDMRLLGASAATAVAVSIATVVVYAGHVKATSGGQTVNIGPGTTLELRAGEPPREVAEPVAVGATADIRALEDKLRAANEQIAKLTAELAARTVSHDPPPGPDKDQAASAAQDHVTSPGKDHAAPTDPAPDHSVACDQRNIDDTLQQATNQYSAGFANAALGLVRKCLVCQQNTRMYRLAAVYACAAHDVATAKEMFSKVPPQLQAAIQQRCQQEGISLAP